MAIFENRLTWLERGVPFWGNGNFKQKERDEMGVSENSGTPKSSILIGFSIINHPFWGTPIFGNTQIDEDSQGNS